jgi:phage major head subunit gpT-like protein
MSKWTGERKADGLGDQSLTVLTDKYTSTLDFDVDEFRRDKTGQVRRRVSEMGAKAATLPQRIFTDLLVANGTAYEGSSFFADSHAVGTCDNNLAFDATDPGVPTTAEMSQAILQAVQAIYGFLDENGDPVNEFAKSFMVMVPTHYWWATVGALKDIFTSAGVSNTLPNAGVSITPVVNPRMAAATDTFYTFRTDAPVKPFIWQEESIGDSFKTLGMDSSGAFWKERIAFGAKRICNGALGRFELATLTTLS